MAKVRTRGHHLDGKHRAVHIRAVVKRGHGRIRAPFEACVTVGGSTKSVSCARGTNPRTALANALETVAHKIYARAGAFQGYRRRKRRR